MPAAFAEPVRAAGNGPFANLGCGPGPVTAHLAPLGPDAFGIDVARTPVTPGSCVAVRCGADRDILAAAVNCRLSGPRTHPALQKGRGALRAGFPGSVRRAPCAGQAVASQSR
ncbi:hypothetical protein [Streptomyces sp. NPDC060035]|uniref:hypothetical protein n=1 Tax=Streptomyces sp. NPDC060035 TaxID=3347044 RepID=UPI0036923473